MFECDVKKVLQEISNDFFAFGIPERLGRVFWTGHIPFALWIVQRCRPTLFVELGTETGVSYNAFCWAVQRNALSTKCFAIDTWRGDPHAGASSDDIFNDLAVFHERYASFSTLLRRTFDEANKEFAPDSIDILHIDGFHTYEAVKQDFAFWLPKLSSNGIILLHDVTVRSGNFGVWRLWEELRELYPTFLFTHSNGLGVVAVGSEIPASIKFLFDGPTNPELETVRSYFESFGAIMEERGGAIQAAQFLKDPEHPLIGAIQSGFGFYREGLANAAKAKDIAMHKTRESQKRLYDMQNSYTAARRDMNRANSDNLDLTKKLIATTAKWSENASAFAIAQQLARNQETRLWSTRIGRAIFTTRLLLLSLEKQINRRLLRKLSYSYNLGPGNPDLVLIHESRLFDYNFYLTKYPDVLSAKLDPLEHYLQSGAAENRWPNAYFDPDYYLKAYTDISNTEINPLAHFIRFGAKEGRNPNACFNTSYYLRANPDVASVGVNPLLHFMLHGEGELRRPHPLFDPSFIKLPSVKSYAAL